jgi:hypothetical protein
MASEISFRPAASLKKCVARSVARFIDISVGEIFRVREIAVAVVKSAERLLKVSSSISKGIVARVI